MIRSQLRRPPRPRAGRQLDLRTPSGKLLPY
ncbi:hypothetical protein HNR40_009148 [Nonomuraea endophytica]|uniref:Uncharacterized protein n=1 Tax=Nonomuraea endophytica TaxID=714136 RepID=A0A7W8AF49_9ACTN|nr:hypothetical protein [Nonomuraea endophytica]